MLRFLIVLTALLAYTAVKAVDLWPNEPFLAMGLTLPFFILMISPQFAYRARRSIFETPTFQILAWTGSLAMGLWSTFILFSIILDFVKLVAPPLPDLYRPLLILSFVISLLGWLQVWRGPKLRKVSADHPDLPDVLHGLKIVQISDLHIGPTIRKNYVEDVVRKVNSAAPDLIVITGDIADAKAESIVEHIRPLSEMKAKHGIYYVTGNHEYYWGADELVSLVQQVGATPLINENRILDIDGVSIMIAGITDSTAHQFLDHHQSNPAKALDGLADYKILLAHRPGDVLAAEPLGAHLQFSGHTHAGQFFPFSFLIPLAHKYYRGLNRHGKTWLYVNPGTGYWGPANRFGIASEITVLQLAKGK